MGVLFSFTTFFRIVPSEVQSYGKRNSRCYVTRTWKVIRLRIPRMPRCHLGLMKVEI